jgi:hypothetical protein
LALRYAVHRHDQGAKLALIKVLNFIDGDHDGGARRLRGSAHVLEQVGEIAIKIAAVGYAAFGIDVETEAQALGAERDAEALENPQGAIDRVRRCIAGAQPIQRGA